MVFVLLTDSHPIINVIVLNNDSLNLLAETSSWVSIQTFALVGTFVLLVRQLHSHLRK